MQGSVQAAGYHSAAAVVAGAQVADPVFHGGAGLTADKCVYTASLSKQITAACAALLVRQGRLDTDDVLAQWMPELPPWSRTVRVRHLIHHTSGLPQGVHIDDVLRNDAVRTTDSVVRALVRRDQLDRTPGTAYEYCNAGYVCLAVVVSRAAGQPLPEFAQQHVFERLGMNSTRYWTGPAPHPPGATPLDPNHPAPLSLGDGGVWSTARDLLRWNRSLLVDHLGISEILHTPGHLEDGTPLDYAWGVVVGSYRGHRLYRHSGGWPGVTTQLVSIPGKDASLVVVALDDDSDRSTLLANIMIYTLLTS
ncbi:serine hydrolase domain-containing protein [Paractinoplanes rishiriensis]|uniref:serine hydrolase domain-containing protein n=1 Tax=Paractinoplanes rishiriensis TaxID=1050105 RepID=UPI001EF17195|nr:serine hydrolase domain-containing protein [Actinoplanes rishiriensis]